MRFIFYILLLPHAFYSQSIVYQQDLADFPAYETNGPGPSSPPRFIEISNELPHPDMPDTEPEPLLQMQDKISFHLGLSLNNSTIITLNDSLSNFNKSDDFPYPRFLSKTTALPLTEKYSTPQPNYYENSKFIDAWASSVYTYKSSASQHAYPAINAVLGFSYWCSTGLHEKSTIITWEGVLDYPRRLSHLWVRWAYAPGSYRILSSTDGVQWEERTSWQTGFKGVLWQWLSKIFWWWRWFYKAYSEYIPFETPIWAKHIRIQMREPVFQYFGIYRVEAWIRQWTVMLKVAAESDTDWCLVMSDGSGNDGRAVEAMECIEAIAIGDGREIWTLQNNFQITSYVGGKCIELADGETNDDSRIQINDCWNSNGAGDGRDKWIMDHTGLTRVYKDQSKCMTVVTNSELENLCLNNANTFASSTLNDGQHEAHMAVDGLDDNYWASSPGVLEATYTVLFNEPKTVKDIYVKWKYPAEEFEVLGLIAHGLWESIDMIKNNGKSINFNKIDIGSKSLMGIKLVMLKTRDKFNGMDIYGIWDIRCLSGTKAVKLKDCKELDDIKTNRFIVEDIEDIDLQAGPRLLSEKVILNEKTNKLLGLVNTLIGFPKIIYKLLEKGQAIAKLITNLEEKLVSLDIKMNNYRNFLSSEQFDLLSSMGANAMNPIRDCSFIHKAFPHKTNGFYWIKPECAGEALRVFCNFELNEGKSYYFLTGKHDIDFKSGVIKDHIDLQYQCSRYGLFPLQVTYPSELSTIQKYLKSLDILITEGQIIPLGYDWGCHKGACTSRYRSFDSEGSLDITDEFIKNLDNTNILNMAFNLKGYVKDAIGLSMEIEKGYVYLKLDQFSIKGILCSSTHDDDESLGSDFISKIYKNIRNY